MPTYPPNNNITSWTMEGGKEDEGECSGLFVRKPTQEFESAMAKGGEGNGKGEGRRAGSESEGASESEWRRSGDDDCGCFCFSGRRRSLSPLLLRRPRLQTELKRPRASLLSSKPVGSLHFDSVGFTFNHLWKNSCKESQTWPEVRPIVLASLFFYTCEREDQVLHRLESARVEGRHDRYQHHHRHCGRRDSWPHGRG